jgi:hypothetical protein
MFDALSDFIIIWRVERRLSELRCRSHERGVRACIEFLSGRGDAELVEIRTPDLRRFLAGKAGHRPALSSQAAHGRGAALLLRPWPTRARRALNATVCRDADGSGRSGGAAF